jgi:hypothetical protein
MIIITHQLKQMTSADLVTTKRKQTVATMTVKDDRTLSSNDVVEGQLPILVMIIINMNDLLFELCLN